MFDTAGAECDGIVADGVVAGAAAEEKGVGDAGHGLDPGEFSAVAEGELDGDGDLGRAGKGNHEGKFPGDFGDFDAGFEPLDVALLAHGLAISGERAVGCHFGVIAQGDLRGGKRLEVGTLEGLAEDIAAGADFEGVSRELALAKKRGRKTHGLEGGGVFAERKQRGVVGENRRARGAAADARERGVGKMFRVVGGQRSVGRERAEECGFG